MSKVIVIGAGASGVIASLKASVNNEVILIDSNDKCGKKILVTGNGKCNYWNEDINVRNYFTNNTNELKNIMEKQEEVLDYLYHLGIFPKIKNGYYYPASSQAASVREIFERELDRYNVTKIYNNKVLCIEKSNDKYIVKTVNGVYKADKLIIATGSKASPKTGSDGFGYEIAKQFNHNINPVLPALVSLNTNEVVKEWAGVRSDVRLSLFIDENQVIEEEGEIQLTENGISGICTFNVSGLVSKALYNNKKVKININFIPTINNPIDFFEERNDMLQNRTVEELLESVLNYKLVAFILKRIGINKNSYWNLLDKIIKQKLIDNLENFEVNITSTNTYDNAQVCTGGIPLGELNKNMESNYNKNLYFVGEILDVDGKCGGFNLAFAFITGYIAGSSV